MRLGLISRRDIGNKLYGRHVNLKTSSSLDRDSDIRTNSKTYFNMFLGARWILRAGKKRLREKRGLLVE